MKPSPVERSYSTYTLQDNPLSLGLMPDSKENKGPTAYHHSPVTPASSSWAQGISSSVAGEGEGAQVPLDRANAALFCKSPCSYMACKTGERPQALQDSLLSHRLIASLGRLATEDPLGGLL